MKIELKIPSDLCPIQDENISVNQDAEMQKWIQQNEKDPNRAVIFMVNPQVSLLQQSLIHQACFLVEEDSNKASKLYNTICKNMYNKKLLDNTYTMEEFQFIRSQYKMVLQHFVKLEIDGNILPIVPSCSAFLEPGVTSSRYQNDFVEGEFIAKGGFGGVWKAKHRLDGVEYAIKKICIKSCDLTLVLNHLAEAKMIAALDHPNIVSYKYAWLDPLLEKKKDENELESEEDIFTDYSSTKDVEIENETGDESEFQVSFQYSNEQKTKTKWNWILNEMSLQYKNRRVFCKIDESNKLMRSLVKPSPSGFIWATLYIQMPLYDETMEAWLKKRTEQTHINAIVDMFNQLSKGVHYIHDKNIIHHDIKPSNIFVQCQGLTINVRLGDFGLACTSQNSHKGNAIGTEMYAAPEQLNGECNSKSDLYSMGLIFCEMIEKFVTTMEKIEQLRELRKGNIPEHITNDYPKLAEIISKLVQDEKEERIDASKLLKMLENLKENKDEIIRSMSDEIQTLKNSLEKKDHEILKFRSMTDEVQTLKNTLDKKDHEILKLRLRSDEEQTLKNTFDKKDHEILKHRSRRDEVQTLKNSLDKKDHEILKHRSRKDEVQTLKNSLDKKDHEILKHRSRKDEVQTLKNSLDKKDHEILKHRSRKDEVQTLKNSLDKKDHEILKHRSRRDEVQTLKNTLDKKDHEILKHRSRRDEVQTLKNSLDKKDHEILKHRSRRDEVQTLKNSLDKKDHEILKLRSRRDEVQTLDNSLDKKVLEIFQFKYNNSPTLVFSLVSQQMFYCCKHLKKALIEILNTFNK